MHGYLHLEELDLKELQFLFPEMNHEALRKPADIFPKQFIQPDSIVLIRMKFYPPHLYEHHHVHVLGFVLPVDCQPWRQFTILLLTDVQLVWDPIPPLDETRAGVLERAALVFYFNHLVGVVRGRGWSPGFCGFAGFLRAFAPRDLFPFIGLNLILFVLWGWFWYNSLPLLHWNSDMSIRNTLIIPPVYAKATSIKIRVQSTTMRMPRNTQTEVRKQGCSNVLTAITNSRSSFSSVWIWVMLTFSQMSSTVV